MPDKFSRYTVIFLGLAVTEININFEINIKKV